jgi:hypothetical protein
MTDSIRRRAWRCVMIATINHALDAGMFGLDPDGVPVDAAFAFEVAGIPARGHIADAGWDELVVKTVLWPHGCGRYDDMARVCFLTPRASLGDCYAYGWLERRKGRWLQTSKGQAPITCKRDLLPAVAAIHVEPKGYADHGKFMM